MRRLLLLSYAFPPDNAAAAIRPGQLRDFLPEQGYECLVLASSREGARSEGRSVWRVPTGAESVGNRAASLAATLFMRFGAPYDDRLPWAPAAIAAANRLIREEDIAAIYSTSPYLASHLVARQLKAKFALPWVADFQDPVCDNPFRTRQWPYPYDALIERTIFARADRLIANTDTVASVWRERYPQFAAKVSVLWNSYDPRDSIVATPVPARPHRVLAHVGTLYGERHPEKLLTALERLGIGATDIRVRLVGPIERRILQRHGPLLERMRSCGLVEFDNRLVERDEALRETAAADYLLLLDLNEKNAALQLPSKLLDYVRFGKPILAYTPKDSPVERILARSGVFYVAIDPRESDLTADRKLRDFLHASTEPRAVTPWFQQNFSAQTQAGTVAALLDDLLGSKP